MDEEKTCKIFRSIQGRESKANHNNPIFGRVKVGQNAVVCEISLQVLRQVKLNKNTTCKDKLDQV